MITSMTRLGPRRLTGLQTLMREWSTLAPYNCIHAMRLSAPAELDRWRNAVSVAMQDLAIVPESIPLEQTAMDLEAHLEAELNRPFSALASPFRFFVIDINTDGHWFGVTFDHWLADDFSCRSLMERIHSIYRAGGSDTQKSRLEWMPAVAPRSRWRGWPSFIRQTMILRRACRTPLRDPMDFHVRTFNIVCPEGQLEASQRLAKENGATVHDVLLAATAQAFGVARKWETRTGRDRVALTSAMDLRRFESYPRRRCGFGLLLNQFIVLERHPHEVSLAELTRSIAAQTRPMKATPEINLFGATLLFWRLSRSRRAKATLFSRGAPMVAGLSNVNLTGSWIEQSGITEYRRIAPAGPVIPMVLMITTLGGRLFIDVTFRTAAFAPAEAEHLIKDIIRRLPSGAS